MPHSPFDLHSVGPPGGKGPNGKLGLGGSPTLGGLAAANPGTLATGTGIEGNRAAGPGRSSPCPPAASWQCPLARFTSLRHGRPGLLPLQVASLGSARARCAVAGPRVGRFAGGCRPRPAPRGLVGSCMPAPSAWASWFRLPPRKRNPTSGCRVLSWAGGGRVRFFRV